MVVVTVCRWLIKSRLLLLIYVQLIYGVCRICADEDVPWSRVGPIRCWEWSGRLDVADSAAAVRQCRGGYIRPLWGTCLTADVPVTVSWTTIASPATRSGRWLARTAAGCPPTSDVVPRWMLPNSRRTVSLGHGRRRTPRCGRESSVAPPPDPSCRSYLRHPRCHAVWFSFWLIFSFSFVLVFIIFSF